MYISKFTDYAFRTLIYLANNNDRLCTVDEIGRNLAVSENHIKKIVHKLAKGKFINSLKGRTGGIRLALNPKDINLYSVLMYCNELENVVDCQKNSQSCVYFEKGCKLRNIIDNAVISFAEEFKKYSLKDII